MHEWGRLVYYQGRLYSVRAGDKGTKRFPHKSEVPLGAGNWVYNIDEVRKRSAKIVVVVESILNVLSLEKKFAELGWDYVVAVCVFKHALSPPQAAKIMACPTVAEVVLLFDADAVAGAWKSSEKLINQRAVTIAEMPQIEGRDKLDANDDVELAIQAIEARKVYSPASKLLKLLDDLD